MKIRTLKLRDAHPKPGAGNGSSSFCSILWDQQGFHLVTASSSDPSISIHDPLLPSSPPRVLRHHRDGVTALAISPNSTCLASGSIDHSVKLYKFPGGEFETNITRFTLPLRALAFNRSGTMLAAAGDDEGIKLINTIDGTIARVLKGHQGPVTCLAFDPLSEYLASIESFGTVIIWELQSGTILHNLKGIAPNTASDMSVMNVLSWSPDGETLAIPGLRNDVVMYDRDTAEKLFSLRGDHIQPVCFLSWSPNGKYMATSSLDRQILIWDVDKKQDIDRQKVENRISCMAWKPFGNALAVIDIAGKYGIWDSVVPSSMKSPTEDIPRSQTKKSDGLRFYEEEDEEPSASGSLSDLGEDIGGESEPTSRKRLRKKSEDDGDSDEEVKREFSLLPKTEKRTKSNHSGSDNFTKGNDRSRSMIAPSRSKMQEAFQPGATPVQPGKRHFLCYNMLGTITTIENDGYSHIEIDFHDTGRGHRVPSMTDYFGFNVAALNESGSVFANPCKGEKNMSTLMYRPFSSWASNSEWSMRFEGEEVKVVALGTGWVAAITSLNFLRIYSEGGMQRHILSLDGPVVTASGFQNKLAVVTHASDCLPSNDQVLEFQVFNVSEGTQPYKGRLPLTPGSHLVWFGFSEEGQLSSYDSKGFLRVFTSHYGGSWLPLFSASKEKKSGENYWIVGLTATKVFCIVCKSPDSFPQVMPKPVLTLLNLSFPLASSDLGADALENEFILNNMQLTQLHRRIEEMTGAGLDAAALDDEAFDVEAAQDRCILRLIASCCNGDKLIRATELVKLLSLEKSVRGAIKLVTALKLPNLAERFNDILEERLLNEAKEPSNTLPSSDRGDLSPAAEVAPSSTKTLTSSARSETPQPITHSTMPKLSAPLFVKKANRNGNETKDTETITNAAEGKSETNKAKLQALRPISPFPMPPSSNQETGGRGGGGDGLTKGQRPSNPFLKSSENGQEAARSGDLSEVKSQRPANPFKKTSTT